MRPRYWQLEVVLPDGAAEAVTNFVWEQGALGVVEDEDDGGPRLRAFFPDSVAPVLLRARVQAYLDALHPPGAPGVVVPAVVGVADEVWADAWRAHFRPLPVGRSLVIVPPWETPPGDGRLVLVIEPGRAFGTGHHGSTAGCLATLETVIARDRPTRLIDVGTGSGILAVAAARLGVERVVAVDSDPDAIAATLANAARNAVDDRVEAWVVDARDLDVAPAPVVVANILATAHRALAARYRELVAPGGTLVLGGLLDAELADVAEALATHRLVPDDRMTLDGWTTLALRAAGGPPGPPARP